MGRIRQPLRERSLDYASLSDPILVMRAKNGDAAAPTADPPKDDAKDEKTDEPKPPAA